MPEEKPLPKEIERAKRQTIPLRAKLLLLGAFGVPVASLILYAVLAGDRVFLDLPTDTPMAYLSAFLGIPFVLMLPINAWLCMLAVLLYIPLILVVIVIVAGYIACGYGRCI